MTGRFHAATYDWFLSGAEKGGLADKRAALLQEALGETIELGAGTGLNFSHYPPAVTRLVLTEPDEHMARRLRESAAGRPETEIVQAPGEALPFPDDSFDTAVATLMLCTVPDPEAVLDEVARVLRPGGRFLFLEHVRSHDERLARWQDRLQPVWGWVGGGCNPNRSTLATLHASPLEVETVSKGRMPKAPPIVRPLIAGVARAGETPC